MADINNNEAITTSTSETAGETQVTNASPNTTSGGSSNPTNKAEHDDKQHLSPAEVLKADPTYYGQAYSERNPPTNIQQFQERQQYRQDVSKRYPQSKQTEEARSKDSKDQNEEDDGPRAGETDDVPIGAEKSNVLFHPTPDIDLDLIYSSISANLKQVSYMVFGAITILDWLFIGGGYLGFLKSLIPASGVAVAVYFTLATVAQNSANHKIGTSEAKAEKLKYVPESVEWMNSLVETLWHTLQQEFFDGIATQINETIKPLIPEGIPATVKITQLGHGNHSVRILSMRSLPDHEFGPLVPTHGIDKSASIAQVKEKEKAIEREEGGVFYNLEIAIAYHEPPMRPRQESMHVDILAAVGPIPLPIFVQVKEFVATIRVRLQLHPDLPFLKNATFALTGNPMVNTCVSLGFPWTLDLLNLPLIDTILTSQINAAAAAFVQPKSMSLDLTIYLGGSDQLEETEAIGLLVIKIHIARKLARQDTRGPGADPYLTVAFNKYEKPMYATRIIKGDRNPVWEESAIVLIRAEHVKRQENVLLRLWDSDTTGSDDVSGVCEFPLQDLVLDPNNWHKREDQLQGETAGTDAEGMLEWEIGYFPRANFKKDLRTDAKDPRDHHGEKKKVSEEAKEQTAQNTVPDPELPSGILGLTIHQCLNVKVSNPNTKSMGYVKVRGQDSDGEDMENEETIKVDYIPSLYVSADINDELNYRTRVKSITSSPTFNSSHETYVRDWRMATLTFSVWDTRKHADDCLVGVVALKMSEIFHESSSLVKFYDLKGGAGTGRLRVSMIFRSIGAQLEKSLLGYEIGTYVFSSPIVATGKINTRKLILRTAGSRRVVRVSETNDDTHTWKLDEKEALMPVQHRYMSPLVLEFAGITEAIPGPLGKMTNKNKHYAVLWLHRLLDNETEDTVLPVYKTDNPNRLIQNVVNQSDDTMSLEKVGEVKFKGRFKAGLDESHEEFLSKGDNDHWSTYQSWVAARKSGQRQFQAERSTNQTVEKLAAIAGEK